MVDFSPPLLIIFTVYVICQVGGILEKEKQRNAPITKHSSALYIGMAKVLPIIDVLGYDGQNSSFSSSSSSSSSSPPYLDSTPITQKGSHISS